METPEDARFEFVALVQSWFWCNIAVTQCRVNNTEKAGNPSKHWQCFPRLTSRFCPSSISRNQTFPGWHHGSSHLMYIF